MASYWIALPGGLYIKTEKFPKRKEKTKRRKKHINNTGDYVSILALTPDKQVIALKEHFEGPECKILHTITGSLSSKIKEEPEDCAKRELIEETGYCAAKIIYLGACFVSARNSQDRAHLFLALDCEQKRNQKLDPLEDIEEPILLALEEFEALINDSTIIDLPSLAVWARARSHIFAIAEPISGEGSE